jgi:ribulose 1,5-bisphosphate carboxylase large subunit-like protein
MSTESLNRRNTSAYVWNERFDPARYVNATYYLETAVDPELAAIGLAKEQSATVLEIPGVKFSDDILQCTARIKSIETIGKTCDTLLTSYRLNTSVYEVGHSHEDEYWRVMAVIAYPIANFEYSLTNLWNAVGGEAHRLGFFNALKLLDIDVPESYLGYFPGPTHGIAGVMEKLHINNRPLFCRSARPGVGLTTEMMLQINEKVLRGGFDAVKDDELTCDTPASPFKERVVRMVELLRRMEDETGEKKYYITNVIDDPAKTFDFIDCAEKAGVDAVLVAPTIQGFEIAREISLRTNLAVLCHCSWQDALTRDPRFGVSDALFIKMQRMCGADMIMLPGMFATDAMDERDTQAIMNVCTGPFGKIKPSLPIIAGGKTPQGLANYAASIGSTDFMIIVATAVDTHPNGLEAGARAFRKAWEKVEVNQA